ncbi:MAG: transposase [Microcoleus sp. SIO2G3]|nr:transposase [Microcoleus sp. SIO2G3]
MVNLLPQQAQVLFLADRGFADVELMRHLKQLGWHDRIRIKSSFILYQSKQGCPLAYSRHHRAQAIFLHSGGVSRKRDGRVHLALAWHSDSNPRWYVVSDEPTDAQSFAEYGWRFDIEEGFLDRKSNGFQLEQSQLRSTPMLTRLCWVVAVAALYLTSLKTEVVSSGQRRSVDPHWFGGSSYLKIGWHWLNQALSRSWPLPVSLHLSAMRDPDPVIASRLQADKQRPPYFRATTVDCYESTVRLVNRKFSEAA